MNDKVFDPKKLARLNNPERIQEFPVDFVVHEAGLDNPKTVIDFGTGTAFFSRAIARRFPASTVYALDISDVMIDWIKSNVLPDYPGIVPLLIERNSLDLPLEAESAELLIMVNLHHELDDPVLLLKSCRQMLKSGGVIAISDWRKEEMETGPRYEIRCEPETVRDQLEKSGFSNIRIYRDFPHNFLLLGEKG